MKGNETQVIQLIDKKSNNVLAKTEKKLRKEFRFNLNVSCYLNGWSKYEESCLMIMVAIHPFEQWNKYREYLPAKNNSMMINK